MIKKIPPNPGCYLMKGLDDEVLYIGKAKNLHKRVASYFQKKHEDIKTQDLVANIKSIDFIVTDNEVESLLLEAKLIRNHKPKYNILLKDSLKYAYLKITDERFPRIKTVRAISGKGRYYGPFTSGKARVLAQKLSSRIFKLRICTTLPKRACLLFYLGQCTAPCVKKVDEKEYGKQVRKAELFLKGKNQELLQQLDNEMRREAKRLRFENAQEIKEQIQSIQHMTEKQKVDLPKFYDQNVVNSVEVNEKLVIQVFQIKKGVIAGKKEFEVEKTKESLASFLTQYYFVNPIPKEIILPMHLQEHTALENYFTHIKNAKVRLTVPKIGYKKQLVKMVEKNIRIKLEKEPLEELQKVFHLPVLPKNMDCFDISNIMGSNATGSCVRFTDAKPHKKFYRHFKIKTVEGINDFAMMKEVVIRRYKGRSKDELPDLIIIDGGKGQLHSATQALQEIHLEIPILSLAKRLEEVYMPGRSLPVRLPYESYSLQLLQQIRDESHRFAVKYHTQLRSRSALKK